MYIYKQKHNWTLFSSNDGIACVHYVRFCMCSQYTYIWSCMCLQYTYIWPCMCSLYTYIWSCKCSLFTLYMVLHMFTTYTTYGLALMKRRKFSRKTTPKKTVFVIVHLRVAFHPQPTSPPIVKYSNRLVQVLVNREILGSVGMALVFKL